MSEMRRFTSWIIRCPEMESSSSTAVRIWTAANDGRGRILWAPRSRVRMIIGATNGVRIPCSQSRTRDAENWVLEMSGAPSSWAVILARSMSIKWAWPEDVRTPSAASIHWSIMASGTGRISGSSAEGFVCTDALCAASGYKNELYLCTFAVPTCSRYSRSQCLSRF